MSNRFRTYHIVAEADVTTNLTAKEVDEETCLTVMGGPVEHMKVSVKWTDKKAKR